MRIIAGFAKGLILKAPTGNSTRPTSDKVRGALFSKLQGRIEGAVFVDFFAGSGLIGLEAASRGAKQVVFVENDRPALRVIHDNIGQFGKRSNHCVFMVNPFDVGKALEQSFGHQGVWDIVWADPPYKDAEMWLSTLLKTLPTKMDADGVFVMEGPTDLVQQNWELRFPAWSQKKVNSFGKTSLLEFCLKEAEE